MTKVALVERDFDEVVEDMSSGNKKVLRSDYKREGRFPIVDQGQDLIGGCTDDETHLVSTDGPHIVFGDHTRIFKYVDFPFCMGADGVKVLVPKPEANADAKYLFHFLKSIRLPDAGYSRHFKFLKRTRIPLPPLEEQRRIAAILDKADAIRQKRKQAIALLDSLTQSIFLEMFGDPLNMDRHQPSALKEVAQLINGDRSKNYPGGDDIKAEGILFLNTKNIDGNRLNLQNSQFISEDKFKSLTRGKLQRGDLVITLRGTLGQCAIFDGPHETGFINAQMMIIRCNDSILPRFLREFLSLPKIQRRLKAANTGSAVPQLTAKQIGEISIPMPNLLEQKKYVARSEKVSEMSENLQRHLSQLQSVFSSLQHRAFSGQL